MTLAEILAFLKHYPTDHPCPIGVRWNTGSRVCIATDVETTTGHLIGVLSGRVDTCPMLAVVTFDEGDHEGIASPLLLRAWLGPVPAVLPEGCEMQGNVRRYNASDDLCISFGDRGMVASGNTGKQQPRNINSGVLSLNPVSLHWVMTGKLPS